MSSLSINTSLNALSTQRKTSQSSNELDDKLERLASGLRIDAESDESSGLAISQEMTSRIKGGAQAVQNLQDGLSTLQTAEEGTERIQENLRRMRELSAQSADESTGDEGREALQDEVSDLTDEVDRVAEETEFNGRNLLNGDVSAENGGTEIQAGTGEDETIPLNVEELTSESLGVGDADVSTRSAADETLEAVNGALNQVATERADIGDAADRLTDSIDSGLIQRENEEAARSRIRDADLARETTERAQSSIRTEAGTSALAQANNLEGSSALQLLG